MEKTLYQWQEECLGKWFASHGRGIVEAVTGSGKTLMALTAVSRLEARLSRPLKVKIVVPTASLMYQWDRAVRECLIDGQKGNTGRMALEEKIGLRGAGRKGPLDCKYMIYVINSARYELARQILAELRRGEGVLLIADECHHYDSGQNRLIFEFLPHIGSCGDYFFSMGLSATVPLGEGGRYLESVLGRRIYSYGMAEASACRTVCPFDLYHIGLSFGWEEREAYEELTDRMQILYTKLVQMHPLLERIPQGERFEMLRSLCSSKNHKAAEAAALYMKLSYKRKSLICLASARTVCAVALVERLASSERILIFGERISQAAELCRLLQEQYPGKVGQFHSKMGAQANKNVLERFRTGDIRILVTCKALDEGVDLPEVSVGIILSGTSTQRQRVQRLGRIIRTWEGKGSASLYYLHVTETSEDECFLPDTGKSRVFELEYSPDTCRFVNYLYDPAARKLLDQMARSGKSREVLMEAERCLIQGQVRADWLLGSLELQKRMDAARYARERNYWFCMKRVSELAVEY